MTENQYKQSVINALSENIWHYYGKTKPEGSRPQSNVPAAPKPASSQLVLTPFPGQEEIARICPLDFSDETPGPELKQEVVRDQIVHVEATPRVFFQDGTLTLKAILADPKQPVTQDMLDEHFLRSIIQLKDHERGTRALYQGAKWYFM